MKQKSAELLRAIAAAIIDSGYAVMPSDLPVTRHHVASRRADIARIAQDDRINSNSNGTNRALINDVMQSCGVSYANARVLIHRARLLNGQPRRGGGTMRCDVCGRTAEQSRVGWCKVCGGWMRPT